MKTKYYISSIAIALLLGIIGNANAQSSTKDLKTRVEAALDSYSMHKLFVNADDNGNITINGVVDALYDKLDIYKIISGVNGVTRIKDFVIVDTPMLPDDIIDVNIERTIRDNSIILEPDKIEVSVTDGFVLLKGRVSYYKEKLMAETISSWQDGVKGIENEINVLPPKDARSDDAIKGILTEIIKNHFPLVSGNISVYVNNGDITIDGEVINLWEKDNLKKEFLQVAGVKNVDENLKVKDL